MLAVISILFSILFLIFIGILIILLSDMFEENNL
jgi:hypothetical protein